MLMFLKMTKQHVSADLKRSMMMTIFGGQVSLVLDMMFHFTGKLASNEFERHRRKSAMNGPTWHMCFGIQFSSREYSDPLSLHESLPLVIVSLVNEEFPLITSHWI